MLHTKIVDLKKEQVNLDNAKKFIASSKFGASIIFTGTVRELNENKKVTGITYDAHEAMVIKSFKEIYDEVDNKLKIKDKAVFIEHVKGYVGLGELSIIIAVATHIGLNVLHFQDILLKKLKKKDLQFGKKNIMKMKKANG